MSKKIFIPAIFGSALIILLFFGYANRNKIKSFVKKNPTIYSLLLRGKQTFDAHAPEWLAGKKNVRHDLPQVNIVVDAGQALGPIEPFWGGFGYDFFYSGATQPKNRALFRLIKETNRERNVFTYYRAHNIFSDKDAPSGEASGGQVYSEDAAGNPVYSWARVDAVFDVILDAGMKPIVELGFMPEALTSDPGRIGDWRAANVAPPKNYRKWRNLVFETVKHLGQRYGAEEVTTWYFEVWNEPDLWHHFWIAHPENPDKSHIEEYLKLYDNTVDGAVAANSQIKIGGPAIAGWADVFETFLRHTKSGENFVTGEKGSRIDFISFHKYGYIEEDIVHGIKFLMDIALAVDEKKFSEIPFLLDETGPSPHSREPWKNSSFVAAWLCKFTDAMLHLEQTYGQAYRPDAIIFWADVGKNFHEGSGSLATAVGADLSTVIKGPVFTSYELLSLMQGNRIAFSGAEFGDYVHGFAARQADQSVDVLVYKINDANPYYDVPTEVKLAIHNLPFDRYYLKCYRIDEEHGHAFHVWQNMGVLKDISEEQVQLLQASDDLELSEPVSQGAAAQGQFSRQMTVKNNSVVLLKLSRVTDFVRPLAPTRLSASSITSTSIHLVWSEPTRAEDGEIADHYQIFRNGAFLVPTHSTAFTDLNLTDDSNYEYTIYSVDAQGNRCDAPLNSVFKTKKDGIAPEVTSFFMPDEKTLTVDFSEPLNREIIAEKSNLSISGGVAIEKISVVNNGAGLQITTTPHVVGNNYVLNLEQLVDCAKNPNHLKTPHWKYRYTVSFEDNFSSDTGEEYEWTHEHTEGGVGQHAFDAAGRRLKVVSGDDVSEKFSHAVPAAASGSFAVTFLPLEKYPDGGTVILRLMEDENNYYQVSNTDGYGPGKVEKIVAGKVVSSANFSMEYAQAVSHFIRILFSPEKIEVRAFNQNVAMSTDPTKITVRKFEVVLAQQNAYFDDIQYEGR
ncbi:MAG: GH39 family glycosyl hydrolase [Candidatus Zhuqueibacterota bacterium]